MWQQLLKGIQGGDQKALARSISLVENEHAGYEALLQQLPPSGKHNLVGITGPPGAGKSTLVDGLIRCMVAEGNTVGVLCVDPSSPFNQGALLGDRIRMSSWYTEPAVFIRSLASRGSMGGLSPKVIELTDLLKAAPFDYLVLETVGVGQSEVEVAGLADVTAVVLVPEAGDAIQTMKAGLMEIADLFVVNKGDRPEADHFVQNLRLMLAPAFGRSDTPVLKTTASSGEGLPELYKALTDRLHQQKENEKKYWLLAEKAYQLLTRERMKEVSKERLVAEIQEASKKQTFNLYQFVQSLYK